MKNNISSSTKLILLHPYIQKQGGGSGPNRLWLLAVISLFTLAFLLTLVYTRDSIAAAATSSTATVAAARTTVTNHPLPLPDATIKAILHYASASNASDRMPLSDLKAISDALRHCPASCNLLVFGLTHETLLWNALNPMGRTVFIEENRYYAAHFEELHPEIEAYDVQYSTRIRDLHPLLQLALEQSRNECRPVQNLLFSDCKLGLNDLPNQLYEIEWDVILVDGPRGYWPEGPGRMAAVFTAGVLARSKRVGVRKTHVFVHDYEREVERVSSEEFLCRENLVKSKGSLAHFLLDKMDPQSFHFCPNHSSSSSSAMAASAS